MAKTMLSVAKELRSALAPASNARVGASVRYGTVESVGGGIAVVTLDGSEDSVPMQVGDEVSSLLRQGDRIKATAQGQSFVLSAASQMVRSTEGAVKLADSFALLAQGAEVRYREAGSGGEWLLSSTKATWYVLKPDAEGAPVLFWCSLPLSKPLCNRPYGSGYASYYEYRIAWPDAAGATSADRLPEAFLGASCEEDTADAYSWTRSAEGLGPIMLVARSSGNLPATRLEVFCASRG